MDKQEATDFVVYALVRHHSPSQIIQAVCEKTGMNWQEAERFVLQVKHENLKTITARQSPLISMLGITVILLGVGVLAWITLETLDGTIMTFRAFPVPGLGNLFYVVLGTAMIIGGLRGIWGTIRQLWNG